MKRNKKYTRKNKIEVGFWIFFCSFFCFTNVLGKHVSWKVFLRSVASVSLRKPPAAINELQNFLSDFMFESCLELSSKMCSQHCLCVVCRIRIPENVKMVITKYHQNTHHLPNDASLRRFWCLWQLIECLRWWTDATRESPDKYRDTKPRVIKKETGPRPALPKAKEASDHQWRPRQLQRHRAKCD